MAASLAQTLVHRIRRLAERDDPRLSNEQLLRKTCAVLDEELQRLPECYRTPLVLCYLQGRTQQEAAQQLHCSLRTHQRRLKRGHGLLRCRLERRGINLSVALLFAALAQQAAATRVSATVACQTATTVVGFAVDPIARAGALSGLAVELARGVLQAMFIPRFRMVAMVLLIAGLVATDTAFFAFAGRANRPAELVRLPSFPAVLRTIPVPRAATPAQKERARKLLQEAAGLVESANAAGGAGLRDRAMADIAVLQWKLGDRTRALKTFATAHQWIDARSDPLEFRHLAWAHAQVGDAQAVLDIVQKDISEDVARNRRMSAVEIRDLILQESSEAAAKAGHVAAARRLAHAITKEATRKWAEGQVPIDLTLGQAAAHQFDKARRTIETIADPAERITAVAGLLYANFTFSRLPERPGLAMLLAQAGRKTEARQRLAEAVQLADKMPESAQRQKALAGIACAEVRIGQVEAARNLLKRVSSADWRGMVTAALVEELGAAGQAKEAQALVSKLPSVPMKVHCLHHLASGLARAGKKKEAAEVFAKAMEQADSLPVQDRHIQFHNIASAQAEAGDAKAARQILDNYLKDGTVALANVAHSMAAGGHIADALKLAERLPDNDWWKTNIYRDAARLETEKGKDRAALEWIGKVSSPLLHGNALLGVAEGLVGRR